jgi:hypothetical protein
VKQTQIPSSRLSFGLLMFASDVFVLSVDECGVVF